MAVCELAGAVHPPLTPPSREGDLDVSSEADLLKDRFHHAISIFKDVIVPKADHAVAVRFDDFSSRLVRSALRMLSAIAFDCKAQRSTGKVDDEVTDLVLTSKLYTELSRAKSRPKAPFRLGHVVAQFARNAGQSFFCHLGTPIPNPFPKGKGLSLAKLS